MSVLGGIIIPFCYSITAGPLSTYTENPTVHRIVYIPIGWPKLILYRLSPTGAAAFENKYGLLPYIIICDIVLYSLLTYFFLLAFSTRKSKIQAEPPPPFADAN
ncbi:MAG TPA: hypothetical protein VF658_12370 [Pyrinomonadaceae bacterium]